MRDWPAPSTIPQRRSLQSGGTWRRTWSVLVDVVRGSFCGVPWSEVGAVTGEDVDPLAAGGVDGLGDEVGGVAVAAPGHGDVR